MGILSKFNILTNEALSGIDASKHPDELFGTIDDVEEKVVVDSELRSDSENPVQNKVITEKIAQLEYLKQYPIVSTYKMAADQTSIPAYTNQVIAFATREYTTDTNNLITISNGVFSFDKKVKKVRLYGMITFSGSTNATHSAEVYKNSTLIVGYPASKEGYSDGQNCPFETPIIALSDNDTVSMKVFSQQSCNVTSWYSRVNVEVYL